MVFVAGGMLGVIAVAGVSAQEPALPPKEGEIIVAGEREIIKEAVIQKEGHAVTIREAVAPGAVMKAGPPPPITPDIQTGEEALPRHFLMVVATAFDDRATLVEWSEGGEKFAAWSPVNFFHFGYYPNYEARGTRYTLMCMTRKGGIPEGPVSEMTDRERLIVNAPTLDALGEQLVLLSGSHENPRAMDFLYGIHDHYNQNREQLAEAYEAKMLERRLNPPQPPTPQPKKDATVTYWKYHKSSTNAKK